MEQNKNKEGKTKKSCDKSNLVYSKDFIFYKYSNTKEFDAKRYFEFWISLALFYHHTEEINLNNKDQKRDLRKEKLCLLELLDHIMSF